MKQLEINTSIQILKPIEEVFEAIIDPNKMSNYFIAEGSGIMEEGKEIEWKFPEFEDRFNIKVLKVKRPELIIFVWEGAKDNDLEVSMKLERSEENKTLIKVSEGKMENNEEGIQWLGRNSEGWANFLACLKAYLEYGINLRKGAFDFMKT